jgi:pyruvate/2-oxoglutarate/acetoin dehydrogenase E1 component
MTYAEALNEALREEMRRDPTVFVMGEDVAIWGGGGVFGVTKGLVEEDRYPAGRRDHVRRLHGADDGAAR